MAKLHAEELHLPFHGAFDHRRLAPVHLGLLSGSEVQGEKDLPSIPLPRRHVTPHGTGRTAIRVLITQPLVDPLGRVTLLPWTRGVLLQPGIDPGPVLFNGRPLPRPAPPIPRRDRIGDRLGDRLPGMAQFLGDRSGTEPVHEMLPTNQLVIVHRQHPPVLPELRNNRSKAQRYDA